MIPDKACGVSGMTGSCCEANDVCLALVIRAPLFYFAAYDHTP